MTLVLFEFFLVFPKKIISSGQENATAILYADLTYSDNMMLLLCLTA